MHNMIDEYRGKTVQHWCPVAGYLIVCDTNRSKSCLHCKFAVHRLVVEKPKFVQYVFLAHVLSLVFFIYYIIVQDSSLLLFAIAFFVFDFGFFCIAKYKILSRKHNCLLAQVQELRNWTNRK